MAINYEIVNGTQYTVDAGSNWVNNDFPGGGVPKLQLILQPINPSTHTVAVSSFRIKGANPNSTQLVNIDGVMNMRSTWTNGSTAVTDGVPVTIELPDGVASVTMHNSVAIEQSPWTGSNSFTGAPSAVGNTIIVEAELLDDYQVPDQNTLIELDIDGDADLIEVPVVTDTGSEPPDNSFKIKVEMTLGDESNCEVHAFTSYLFSTANANGGGYDYYAASLPASPATSSDHLILTPSNGTVVGQTPILGSGVYVDDIMLFAIAPKPGYTLSRHNLSLTTLNSTMGSISYSGQDYSTDSNVQYASQSIVTSDFTPWTNYGQHGLVPVSTSTSNWSGTYYTTKYNNVQVQLDNPQDPPGTVNTINYNNLPNITSGTITDSSSTSVLWNIRLIDLKTNNYLSGFSATSTGQTSPLEGYEFVDGQIPLNYCPGDWNNNVVLITIRGLNTYIPTLTSDSNPPADIVFKINGSAMLDDGSVCSDASIIIDG